MGNQDFYFDAAKARQRLGYTPILTREEVVVSACVFANVLPVKPTRMQANKRTVEWVTTQDVRKVSMYADKQLSGMKKED